MDKKETDIATHAQCGLENSLSLTFEIRLNLLEFWIVVQNLLFGNRRISLQRFIIITKVRWPTSETFLRNNPVIAIYYSAFIKFFRIKNILRGQV